ncbi:hypothetical protein RRG08_045133 [Elysia crispata]|uniref:Uncharacterized protein n=1 Tax=Elysia crispata TaxID=231223 RepID=A0AAE0YT96_9GAST|nr:hypothetical protein RRG08_045133 [Elysia crispata]
MEIHDGLWLESKPGGLGETFRARKSRVDSHSVVDTWCLRRIYADKVLLLVANSDHVPLLGASLMIHVCLSPTRGPLETKAWRCPWRLDLLTTHDCSSYSQLHLTLYRREKPAELPLAHVWQAGSRQVAAKAGGLERF